MAAVALPVALAGLAAAFVWWAVGTLRLRRALGAATVADTALLVAALRGREGDRARPLFVDPLAKRLAGQRGAALVALTRRFPVSMDFVAARTVAIDGMVRRLTGVEDGLGAPPVDTVLNLAAGLDARPFRLPLPPTLRWLDVDVPAILARKHDVVLRGHSDADDACSTGGGSGGPTSHAPRGAVAAPVSSAVPTASDLGPLATPLFTCGPAARPDPAAATATAKAAAAGRPGTAEAVCAYAAYTADLARPVDRRRILGLVPADARCVAITEGLLNYLQEADVRALARELHAHPGIQYWIADVGGAKAVALLDLAARYLFSRGHAVAYHFGPRNVPAFFAEEGWHTVELAAIPDVLREAGRWAWYERLLFTLVPPARRNLYDVVLLAKDPAPRRK